MLVGSSLLTRLLGVKLKICRKVNKNPDTNLVVGLFYILGRHVLGFDANSFLPLLAGFSGYLLFMVHEAGYLHWANHILSR